MGHRFDLWSGKTPHGTEHLSLCATLKATSPQRKTETVRSLWPATEEPLLSAIKTTPAIKTKHSLKKEIQFKKSY